MWIASDVSCHVVSPLRRHRTKVFTMARVTTAWSGGVELFERENVSDEFHQEFPRNVREEDDCIILAEFGKDRICEEARDCPDDIDVDGGDRIKEVWLDAAAHNRGEECDGDFDCEFK